MFIIVRPPLPPNILVLILVWGLTSSDIVPSTINERHLSCFRVLWCIPSFQGCFILVNLLPKSPECSDSGHYIILGLSLYVFFSWISCFGNNTILWVCYISWHFGCEARLCNHLSHLSSPLHILKIKVLWFLEEHYPLFILFLKSYICC